MTTELRKELERQYDLASAKVQKTATNKAKSNSSEAKENQTNKVCNSDDSQEYLEAPRSYKKEYAELFKSLPPAMRKYLYERESETEKGFSRINNELNNRRWIDEVFNLRAKRLERLGIQTAQDWIKSLAAIDDALEENPQTALHQLAQIYGVNLPTDNASQIITEFSNSSQEPIVKKDMLSADLNSESANKSTLSALQNLENKFNELAKLFKAHLDDNIIIKESKKARDASFSPKGKNFEKDLSKLSTREVLELQLADYD